MKTTYENETTKQKGSAKICLYFGNGKTQVITTSDPDKAKRIFKAKTYVVI